MKHAATALLLVLAGCSASLSQHPITYPWQCTPDTDPDCYFIGTEVSSNDRTEVENLASDQICPEGVERIVYNQHRGRALVICSSLE